MNKNLQSAGATTFGLMKYVHVMFFTGAIILGWLLMKIIETTWTSLNLAFAPVPPPSSMISVLSGAVVSAGVTFYLWKHAKVNRLAIEIITELSKVTWPTRKELYASTIVVIIFSIIASITLGLFDFFWAWATDLIYM